ncbi:MAG: hypothetical protein M1338_05335 [Patescibacteria group bacterium]|nr:hypothetical protein [Patescibacteria group bacterium]
MMGVTNNKAEFGMIEKSAEETQKNFEFNFFPVEQKMMLENIFGSFFKDSKIEKKFLVDLVPSIEYVNNTKELNQYYGLKGEVASAYNYKENKIILYPEFFTEVRPEIVLGHEFAEALLIKGILNKNDFSQDDLELISPEWVTKLRKPTNKPQGMSQEDFDRLWNIHKNNQIIADLFAYWLINPAEGDFVKEYSQNFSQKYLEEKEIDRTKFAKNLNHIWQIFNGNKEKIEKDIKIKKDNLLDTIFYGIDEIMPNIEEPYNAKNKDSSNHFIEQILESVAKLKEIL